MSNENGNINNELGNKSNNSFDNNSAKDTQKEKDTVDKATTQSHENHNGTAAEIEKEANSVSRATTREKDNSYDLVTPDLELEATSDEFHLGKEIWDWVKAIAIAVVVALLIRNFLFTFVTVQGPSMESTLTTNDRLLLSKLTKSPKNGDIVVFTPYKDGDDFGKRFSDVFSPDADNEKNFGERVVNVFSPDKDRHKHFVKRVIATEGQKIDIDFEKGIVYVDDKPIDEPYIKDATLREGSTQLPAIVPEGHFFAMGDHRGNSHDSRDADVGMVSLDDYSGKATFRMWPMDKFGKLK